MSAANNGRRCCSSSPHHTLALHSPGQLPNEALARHSDHQWQIKHLETIEVIDDREILIKRLSESDSRVDDYLFTGNPARLRNQNRCIDVGLDFGKYVGARRELLHSLRLASHVHKHKRCTLARGNVRNRRIESQRAYVVDNACAFAD